MHSSILNLPRCLSPPSILIVSHSSYSLLPYLTTTLPISPLLLKTRHDLIRAVSGTVTLSTLSLTSHSSTESNATPSPLLLLGINGTLHVSEYIHTSLSQTMVERPSPSMVERASVLFLIIFRIFLFSLHLRPISIYGQWFYCYPILSHQ